ncbi:MAG: DUF455 family protein [Verrucomicrobia bacterium]|nr:DUF455 family protein [Verrucomicrobiota bacterium]
MELREWATRILSADTLAEKLLEPGILTDNDPGSSLFWDEPTRPTGMHFNKHSRKDKLPKLPTLHKAENRAACLHRFAGHELLAVEIMAYALLAYPQAPKHFRKGVANTLREEQEHVRLYIAQLERLGMNFGDLPLYKHFWAYTPYLRTPDQYVSVMSLTFEMANLDFAPLYGAAFAANGDEQASQLMQQILKDEIAHVSFGWNWLKKLKSPGSPQWDAWLKALPPNLPPTRAMGPIFQEENRLKAGVSQEWIDNLRSSHLDTSTRTTFGDQNNLIVNDIEYPR